MGVGGLSPRSRDCVEGAGLALIYEALRPGLRSVRIARHTPFCGRRRRLAAIVGVFVMGTSLSS